MQMLRNQIDAEKLGKTFQDLYLSGTVKKAATEASSTPAARSCKMPSSDLAVESDLQTGSEQDFVLDLLKQFNLAVTRENYLGLAYPEGVPEDLDETSLPVQIRLKRTQATLMGIITA